MTVVPLATAVASPFDPAALLMTAAPVGELQVTKAVRSSALPSAKVPVAVNCRVEPATAPASAGVTAMVAGPCTVTGMGCAATPEKLALTVVEPGERAVALPLASMLRMAGSAEIQLACEPTSMVVPFDRLPVALNCWTAPTLIVGSTGASVTDSSATTVRLALPAASPDLAVAVTVTGGPALTAVVTPFSLTVAMAGSEVLQASRFVRS